MNYHNPSQELVTACLYTVVILFLLAIGLAIVLYTFRVRITAYINQKDSLSDELVEVKTINFNLRNVIKLKDECIEDLEKQFNIFNFNNAEENKVKIKTLESINYKLNSQISDLLDELHDEKTKALWISKQGIKGELLAYLENYRNLLKKKAFGDGDFSKISKEYNKLFSETKVVTVIKEISITLSYVDPVRIGNISNKEINQNITALKRLVFKL